jgi:hypothetical protein
MDNTLGKPSRVSHGERHQNILPEINRQRDERNGDKTMGKLMIKRARSKLAHQWEV